MKSARYIVIMLSIMLVAGCGGMYSEKDDEDAAELPDGLYTVYLPDESVSDPSAPVAVLDRAGDSKEVVPANGSPYSKKGTLSASDAMDLIRMRVGSPDADVYLRRILDAQGQVVGYEAVQYDRGRVVPNLLSIEFRRDDKDKPHFDINVLPLMDRNQ